MDQATVQLMIAAMNLIAQGLPMFMQLREAANTEDKARLDELLASVSASSNSVADQLRATPPDQV